MSSVSTRAFYGAQIGSASAGLGGAAMPMFDIDMNGTGDFVSILSDCQAAGGRAILKIVGAPATHRGVNSEFSLAMWKSQMDKAFAKTSAQQMGNFVQSGAMLFNYMIDDMKEGSNVFPGGAPTFAEIEAMAEYSKSVWTQVPCIARADNQYMKKLCVEAGASHYTHLDAGWAVALHRLGPAEPWYTNHVNDGRSVKLGAMASINVLNGGSGITAPWNAHPGSAHLFGMSPQEIDAAGAAFSTVTNLIGMEIWAQNPQFDSTDYWHWPSIQTALTALANRAIGRAAGPINWRDISGSTSGSTQTVGGSWALLGTGQARVNTTSNINVPLPDGIPAGSLIGMVAYSRDSAWTSLLPSGWSEAKRVSGTSAQGGDLVLYYKIADGSESGTNQATSWQGTAGGMSCQAVSFAFSGNTTVLAQVLATAGSVRTWAGGSADMGPVAGLTSAKSDALVIVVAAKTADFANGDPVPAGTMSATTSGGETWTRMILSTNEQGLDSGILIDYAATSGLPSITSKSWTQLLGTLSAASGSGAGFMVAFAPATVVAGTPPAIVELDDITMSVSSTLSFTLESTGSTPITWSKTSGPSNITLNTSTGAFQWTPLATGDYHILLTATNDFGDDEDGFVATVVSTGNVPPIITHPGDQTVIAQDRLSFAVLSVDSDGDTVAYSLEDPPAGALIVEDSGHFVWTPTGAQGPGTYPIVVIVSDGQNESRSTFTVTVSDAPWTRTTSTGNGFIRL